MRKLIIPVIILILLLIAGGLYLFTRQNSPVQANNAAATFTLIAESDQVNYRGAADTDYTALTEDEKDLPTGTYVRTDSTGGAHIILPDNSVISLDPDTELQVNFSGNNVSLLQLLGTTWHQVQTVTNGGSYEVQTPTAVASVRGTTFSVDVEDEDNTIVLVAESKVAVNQCGEQGETVVAGKFARVVRGADKKCAREDETSPVELGTDKWFVKSLGTSQEVKKDIKERVKINQKLKEIKQERIKNDEKVEETFPRDLFKDKTLKLNNIGAGPAVVTPTPTKVIIPPIAVIPPVLAPTPVPPKVIVNPQQIQIPSMTLSGKKSRATGSAALSWTVKDTSGYEGFRLFYSTIPFSRNPRAVYQYDVASPKTFSYIWSKLPAAQLYFKACTLKGGVCQVNSNEILVDVR